MNLRDLTYLVAVADLRNFSQAAEQCHISQPTLSNQIKKLEDTLGVQVFERTNKRVMLTDAGQQIVVAARRLLQESEHIKDIAEHARDPYGGTFRLGAFPTLSTYIFPRLVPQFTEAMPKLKLTLREEKTKQLLESLKRGELDAALLALPVQDDYLVSRALFDDVFYLAVPPASPLAAKTAIAQADLFQEPLLLLEEGHCLRDQALEVCQWSGAQEAQDFRATGLETLRQMVKVGIGATLMPQIAINGPEDGIRYIPFEHPAPRRTIGLVWRKTTARLPVIEAMARWYR